MKLDVLAHLINDYIISYNEMFNFLTYRRAESPSSSNSTPSGAVGRSDTKEPGLFRMAAHLQQDFSL